MTADDPGPGRPDQASMLSLDPDTLHLVCQYLDPHSLAAICCTCRALQTAGSSPRLWELLARQRWRGLNERLFRTSWMPTVGTRRRSSSGGDSALSSGSARSQRDTQGCASSATCTPAHSGPASSPGPAAERATGLNSSRSQQQSTGSPVAADAEQRAVLGDARVRDRPSRGLAHRPASSFEAGSSQVNWQRLYGEQNALGNPQFRIQNLQPPGADFISAVAVAEDWGGEGSGRDAVMLATSHSLELWAEDESADDESEAGPQSGGMGRLACSRRLPLDDGDMLYALAWMGSDRVAAGSMNGDIQLYDASLGVDPAEARVCSAHLPGVRSPLVDLSYSPASQRLYALHDATFSMAPVAGRRNVLRAWDVRAQAEVAVAEEFMDAYELVAFAPMVDSPNGSEIIAGAVHGGFCGECLASGIPSLCCHKSPAHSAALCVFDLRAGLTMVARYGLHHRSMYPGLRTARGHYVFTSHVGQPLSVWDRRFMSMPLYEEERLGMFPSPAACTRMAFGAPSRPARNQGMFLDTDGDQLLGRAENGLMWLWDLSQALGWAAPSPQLRDTPAARGRWYLRRSWNSDMWAEYASWPIPLGTLPCQASSLNTVHVRSTRRMTLVGVAERQSADSCGDAGAEGQGEEYVAVASLA